MFAWLREAAADALVTRGLRECVRENTWRAVEEIFR
jgi:hypothetical protein